jgi:DNA-binding NarL/FixJ family response regulator
MSGKSTSSPALHIMLVDDHPIVRRGVRDILTDAFPEAFIEEVSFGGDALLMLDRCPGWDIVILDLSLPDGSGIDVLERMRERRADVPVLILSMHSMDQFAQRAFKAGAAGYLTKDVADTELVIAVNDIVKGRVYFSPGAFVTGAGDRPPHASLSRRELQVMLGIAQGKTVGDIAREMLVTSKTVSTFRTRLLKKMELRSNADITTYVMRHRLMH